MTEAKSEVTNQDPGFTMAFKDGLIQHLNKPFSAETVGNQPSKMIQQAKTDIGKLSRIFDLFQLPIVDKATFIKGIETQGTETYMRPILNDIASVLLNADKSGLSQEVITKGIGMDNYAEIVGSKLCTIVDGRLVVTPGQEEEFAKKELEIARQMLSSVVVLYAQLAQGYQFTPEQQSVNKKIDVLVLKIEALKQAIGKEALAGDWSKELDIKPMAFDEFDQKFETVMGSQGGDLLAELKACYVLAHSAKASIDVTVQSYLQTVQIPFQQMGATFSLNMLNEPAPKQSLEEVKAKVEKLSQLVNYTLEELYKLNESDEHNKLIKTLEDFKDKVSTAAETPAMYPFSTDDVIRDTMERKHSEAVDFLAKNLPTLEQKVELKKSSLWSGFLSFLKSFRLELRSENEGQHNVNLVTGFIEKLTEDLHLKAEDPSEEWVIVGSEEDNTVSDEKRLSKDSMRALKERGAEKTDDAEDTFSPGV